MRLFITGANGYIGGSFLTKALAKGFDIFCCDNFSNSRIESIEKLMRKYSFNFYEIDLKEYSDINNAIRDSRPDVVIHFAALKSVPESEINKELYTQNNVVGTLNLLNAMVQNGIKKIIFSSSAAVYGDQKQQPVDENIEINPVSHYAVTKGLCEDLIKEFSNKYGLNSISLRYFNPLGIHSEKIFFDSLQSKERNVLGNIMACYLKMAPIFRVYGNDHATHDGTAIRDYIHIDDLIEGHFSALKIMKNEKNYEVINLGSNHGTSVLELINIFNEVSKIELPYKIIERRKSDLSVSYADSRKSNKILKWETRKTVKDMCESYFNFFKNG